MLHHFFSIFVITIFSVLTGIFVNAMFNDFGISPALLFYAMAFLADYKTTIHVKNCQKYETNPLFGILCKKFGINISFTLIFAIGYIINIAFYYIIQDTILTYILGICHLCTGINNYHVSKKVNLQKECTS